jgi:septal ring factor EnvC (AmiA/AmiB activator)
MHTQTTNNFRQLFTLRFLFFSCWVVSTTFAQDMSINKANIEQERHKYQKRIAEAMRALENNDHNQKESISKLEGLNYQLGLRKNLIDNLQTEVSMYDNQIIDIEKTVIRKQTELENLRREYADVIRAYSQKDKTWAKSVLAMYFSASSLRELLSRNEYFKQYSQDRQKQMSNIHRLHEALKRQQQELVKIKAEKDKLLGEQVKENLAFEQNKEKYSNTLAKLKQDANSLKVEIEKSRKAITAIDKIVLENITNATQKNEIESKKDTKNKVIEKDIELLDKNKMSRTLTTEEEKKNLKANKDMVFSTFAKAKGFLKMPVESGFISRKFGVYQHPIYPKVLLENHGVDIRTEKNASVIAVFGGEVVAVNKVPGAGILVMLEHNKEYYTIYAKLESTKVIVGNRVQAGDKIGIVGLNADAIPELQFQVWQKLIRLNPEEWLLQ